MSIIPPPDYRKAEQQKWLENVGKVKSELMSGNQELSRRIEVFANRFGLSRKEIEARIYEDDPIITSIFAKTPGRQNLHRDLAIEWLQNLGLRVVPFDKTRGVCCVTDEGMFGYFPNNYQYKPSRPLDFYWEKNQYRFYIARIYTHESGGAQDRGYRELQNILKNFLQATDPRNILVVIADGEYYNIDRINELKRLTRTAEPKSYAGPIEEVPYILTNY